MREKGKIIESCEKLYKVFQSPQKHMYTNQAEEPASPVCFKFNVWPFSLD